MTDGFKYTIPITKAEVTDDGLYLEGIASGLGLDSQGHEMDPVGIERFAAQITERAESGDPVPFVDWHKDGITTELGFVAKASVDGDWNLHVRVKLDDENPAAVYMHTKAMKHQRGEKGGKQYGMSVAGKASDWVTRFDEKLKQTVYRFKDIALREISATTKPIWTPSFGTVLAKSVIDEADAESVISEGDSPEMSKKDTEGLNEEATAQAPADETVTDAPAEAEAEETAEEAAEATEAEAEDATDVEKAGARYSKTTKAKFLAKYRELGDLLRAEGILDDEADEPAVEKSESTEKADEATTSETTEESDSAEAGDTPDATATDAPAEKADEGQADASAEDLRRALAEMTARAEKAEAELAEKPAAPQLVVKPETAADEDADLRKELAQLPPGERLLAAFALRENARR